MCSPTDSLMVCQLKKGQCSPVGAVFSPPGGPVKALGNDTALNRTAVAASISTALSTPAVAAAVAAAVVSCPEPVDYKISDFIACLKTACMDNVVVSSFVRTLPFTGVPGPWLRLRRSRPFWATVAQRNRLRPGSQRPKHETRIANCLCVHSAHKFLLTLLFPFNSGKGKYLENISKPPWLRGTASDPEANGRIKDEDDGRRDHCQLRREGEDKMQSVAVCVLVLAAGVSAVPPAGGFAASPWADTSMCSPTDPPAVCQLKKGQCSPLATVFSPPGGPVKAVTSCATATGVVLGPQFYMSIGKAFSSGNLESMVDMVSSDSTEATVMRFCFVNATGLLNSDLVTLNRTAVVASVAAAFTTPALAEAVVSAVATCPEPVNYQLADFISCLRSACMASVTVPATAGGSPFMGSSPFPMMSPYMGSPYMGSPYMGSPSGMKSSPYMGSPFAMKSPAAVGAKPPKKASPKMASFPTQA
nr:uncharacterized protein LOC113806970 [Penaeus vannamei]